MPRCVKDLGSAQPADQVFPQRREGGEVGRLDGEEREHGEFLLGSEQLPQCVEAAAVPLAQRLASRSQSAELYVLATGFRGGEPEPPSELTG